MHLKYLFITVYLASHSIHIFCPSHSIHHSTHYRNFSSSFLTLFPSLVSLFYFTSHFVSFSLISSPWSQAQKCKVVPISPHIFGRSHPHCVLVFIPDSGRAKCYQLSLFAHKHASQMGLPSLFISEWRVSGLASKSRIRREQTSCTSYILGLRFLRLKQVTSTTSGSVTFRPHLWPPFATLPLCTIEQPCALLTLFERPVIQIERCINMRSLISLAWYIGYNEEHLWPC